jgi:hypothetical protein
VITRRETLRRLAAAALAACSGERDTGSAADLLGAATPPPARRNTGLVIGIGSVDQLSYREDFDELQYAETNACKFADMLDRTFQPVKRLYRPKVGQVTRPKVLDAIADLAAHTAAGATAVIYFSGHGDLVGTSDPTARADPLSSPCNESPGTKPSGYVAAWCLWDCRVLASELYWCWRKFGKGRKVVVVADCCHSGSSLWLARRQLELAVKGLAADLAGLLARPPSNELAEKDVYAQLDEPPPPGHPCDVQVEQIAACAPSELVIERPGGPGGVLTTAILAALAANPRGLTYDQLAARVCSELLAANQTLCRQSVPDGPPAPWFQTDVAFG